VVSVSIRFATDGVHRISGIIHGHVANHRNYLTRLVISFILLNIIHMVLPFIIYIESGRLFPFNILSVILAFGMSFPITMNKENYKTILKFALGITSLYSAVIVTLEFPMILPFVKEQVGSFFPFAFSTILFLISVLMKSSIRLIYKHDFISIDHLFSSLVFSRYIVETMEFVYYIKNKIEWQFFLNNSINIVMSTLENIGLFDDMLQKFIIKYSKRFNFLKVMFCVSESDTEVVKQFVDFNDYIVVESFMIKLLEIVFYYSFDAIGIVIHPENSLLTNCNLNWKYRDKVDYESYRIMIYLLFSFVGELSLLLIIWKIWGLKRFKLYIDFGIQGIFGYACVAYVGMHFLFQFCYNYID